MLTITRGIPASGKTTWAHKVSEVVVVGRDDIRRTVFGASKDYTVAAFIADDVATFDLAKVEVV